MGSQGFDFMAFLPLIMIFVIFYFLLLRPQQKKMKEHQNMLSALRRGDKIVTNGGIIGTISKVVDDHELQVDIAEGVRVRVLRSMVSSVLAKTEPAKNEAAETSEETPKEKAPRRRSTTKSQEKA